MDVVGRCDAPGCSRSARTALRLEGAGASPGGLACPRHAAQTELGALLRGWSVKRA